MGGAAVIEGVAPGRHQASQQQDGWPGGPGGARTHHPPCLEQVLGQQMPARFPLTN